MLAATIFDLFLSGLIILVAVGIVVLIVRVIVVSRELARTPSWRLDEMAMEDMFSPEQRAAMRRPVSDGQLDELIARQEAAKGRARDVTPRR